MGVLSRLYSVVAEMARRLDELAERGLRDWVEEMAALHVLQVQAQALLDMVLHLAAELGYTPETPREAARVLEGEGLLSGSEVELVRKVAGFRNIVVHEYAEVDMGMVRSLVLERRYRSLVVLASQLLERATKRGLDP